MSIAADSAHQDKETSQQDQENQSEEVIDGVLENSISAADKKFKDSWKKYSLEKFSSQNSAGRLSKAQINEIDAVGAEINLIE